MSTVRNPLPAYLGHRYPVMIVVNSQLSDESVVVRSAMEVTDALRALDLEIETVMSLEDAEIAFTADPAYCCVILGWGLCIANIEQAEKVISLIRRRTSKLPIMLGMTSENSSHVPLAFVEEIDGFIWQPEDSPAFIAGRIEVAARRYLDTILPPFFGAMVNFAETHEYSWHTARPYRRYRLHENCRGPDLSRFLR